jgi:predicted dehydrogenase
VSLAVVHQHRFRAIVPTLKTILDEGRLGRLHSIEVRVPWWRAQAYYDEPGRGSYARDGGGVLITQAIHVLDLALYLCGPIAAVCARAMTSPGHDMEAEDLAVAVTEWQCGAIGTILASTAHRPGFNDTILISGRDGTALLEGEDLTLWEGQGSAEKLGTHAAAAPPAHPMDFSHDDHRRLLAATLAAIGQGAAPPVSGREACRVLELIDAVTESARLKRWVEVRSETTSKGGKPWMLSA